MLPAPASKRRRVVDRPDALAHRDSASTSTSERESAGSSSGGIFSNRRFFIIPAKITSDDRVRLERDIERGGGRVTGDLDGSTIILTRLTAPGRLARHLTREDRAAWHGKPVLKDSFVKACLDLGLLQDFGAWKVNAANEILPKAETPPSNPLLGPTDLPLDVGDLPVTLVPVERYNNSKYACQRWCPLYCVNEGLVRELGVIRTFRELNGEMTGHLAYSRAIAGIKSLPSKIRRVEDVEGVHMVGSKIRGLVDEYLRTGRLEDADRHRQNPRYNTLRMLARTIHGVGSNTARELYDVHHVRTIDDLRRLNLKEQTNVGLKYWDELQLKIPRAEVEKIVKTVMVHAEALAPGCKHTICGGYRRGKAFSNDVDIIVTHPDVERRLWRGLLANLVNRLQDKGLVTDVVYYTQPESDGGISKPPGAHRHASGFDRLDKAFVVFEQPASPPHRPAPVHRRVDIIVCPPHQYGAAIVGWTGSTMFERDIRRYATDVMGIKFDSGGMCTVVGGREIDAWTEQDVFDKLKLEYIPPEMRNADVAA